MVPEFPPNSPPYRLRLLGAPQIEGPDGTLEGPIAQRHRIALLGLLAVAPRCVLPRDRLLGLLWPEAREANARNLLNAAVHAVRRALGEEVLVSQGTSIWLDATRVRIDVAEFESALKNGDAARAVDLYTGPFLDGLALPDAVEFEHWQQLERDRLERLYHAALEQRAEAAARDGGPADAVPWWRRRLACTPMDGHVVARLIETLAASGDRAGALQAGAIHAALLETEFGVGPDPQVAAMVEQLQRESVLDESAGASDTVAAAAESTIEVDSDASAAEARTAGHRHLADPTQGQTSRSFTHGSRRRLLRRAGGLGILVAGFAVGLTVLLRPVGSTSPPSIAVLPFQSLSDVPRERWFADVMHERLIAELSGVASIMVMSGTSVRPYRETAKPLPLIAAELGAGYLVEGSAIQDGDQAVINVRLYDADGRQVWSQSFERQVTGVLALLGELAWSITREIRGRVTPLDQTRLAARPTLDTAAFNLYAEGVHYFQLGGPGLTVDFDSAMQLGLRAADLFERATRIDPDWAHAWAYRAQALHWTASISRTSRADSLYHLAIVAADRAIALDPQDAAGYAARGFILSQLWDWQGAKAAYRAATRLNPNAAAHGAGLLYTVLGRHEEAIEAFRRALDRDPTSLPLRANFGWALACAGRYAEALPLLDPDAFRSLEWARARRSHALLRAGNYEAAIADFVDLTRAGEYPPDGMAYAYAKAGNPRRAREIVQERRQRLHERNAFSREWNTGIGALADDLALDDRDQLIERLQWMHDNRVQYLPGIRCAPYYTDLLAIPEAKAILEKMGLPL